MGPYGHRTNLRDDLAVAEGPGTLSVKAKDVTPDMLGHEITVHDATLTVNTYHPNYGGPSSTRQVTHTLRSVTDILTEVVARGRFVDGLFRKPKTVTLQLGSLTVTVAPDSYVLVGAPVPGQVTA